MQTGTHPQGAWLLATRDSAPVLRALVPAYVGYEETCAHAVRRLEVPHPNITLIINLGAPLRVGGHATDAVGQRFGSFVAGVHETAVTTENTGPSSGIELNLTPLGAWQLLQTPMTLLANRVLSLEEVLGRSARDLEGRLRECTTPRGADWDARFDLLDAALLHRLRSTVAVPRDVQWAWAQLAAAPLGRSITHVTTELGWSRRRLAATFREYVGLTPKTVSRIVRFDRAVAAVRSGRPLSLSQLAAECGYADHAHLAREFREFSGLSPVALQRRMLPGAGGISPD